MIDKPEDVTPENLIVEARNLRYTGRPHSARVMEWTAKHIEELKAENERMHKRLEDIADGVLIREIGQAQRKARKAEQRLEAVESCQRYRVDAFKNDVGYAYTTEVDGEWMKSDDVMAALEKGDV